MHAAVTLAIICYNSGQTIIDCLGPLLDKNLCPTWIVDNSSTDDSVEFLSHRFPEAKIIRNNINLGYGRAANQVLENCETPYCFLINPDLLLQEAQLQSMLQAADANSEIAILGPVYEQKDLDGSPQIKATEWLIGAAMLFNRAHFTDIGYFDTNIFLFAEETELALKVLRHGGRLAIHTGTCVEHLGGQSSPPSEKLIKIKNFHLGWSNAYVKSKYGLDKGSKSAKLKQVQLRWKALRSKTAEKKLSYEYQALGVKHFINGKPAFNTDGTPYVPD